MDPNLTYRLTLQGPTEARVLCYQPHASIAYWEDDGSPLDLRRVGFYPEPKNFSDAPVVSPETPLGKSKSIMSLKISLGMACNYACTYCNQLSQPHTVQGNLKDARAFVDNLGTWFDGGPKGDGTGVRIEFWGGEPFVYWNMFKYLGSVLRSLYPKAELYVTTNASLLTDEIIDWLDVMDFRMAISHDGPIYEEQRIGGIGDPLKKPQMLAMIRKLHDRLNPFGRIGYNCVLTNKNASIHDVRMHIAKALGVNPNELSIGTEELLQPYDEHGRGISPQTDQDKYAFLWTLFREGLLNQTVTTHQGKLEDFFQSIAFMRPSSALGQKCGMDSPGRIAVDLKGYAITCQNTSSDTKHRIGRVDDYEAIKLTTAWHWTKREECVQCPVVQLCKGACMYNEGENWKQGCDNSYVYNVGILALALFHATTSILTKIEGPVIRRPEIGTEVSVIEVMDMVNLQNALNSLQPGEELREYRA